MKFKLTMVVEADVEIGDDYKKAYGGKTPDQWSEDEITSFNNELASDFSIYDLGFINERNAGTVVSNRRVISFE